MITAVAKLIRPLNCLLAGGAVLVGALTGAGEYNFAGFEVYVLAFGVAALVAGGGNAINDYFDRDIDRVNKPHRPIPSGQIAPETALQLARALFVAGILLSVFLKNPYCFALAGLNSMALIAYAGKLKRTGLPGNLLIGYLVGSTFLFGGLATSPYGSGPLIPLELLVLALLAFFSTIGRELIKGIEDMAGDRRAGVRTFPLVHGPQKAARLAASFLGAAVLLSPLPYVAGVFGDLYLLPLSGSIPAFLLAAVLILREPKPEVAARSSVACKVGMGMGLLAFLAGALS